MTGKNLTMLAVGDLILSRPETDFKFVEPVLKTGDVVVGQIETTYTTRPVSSATDNFKGRDPNLMGGLINANFHVITLAGNNIRESGKPGVEDTVNWIKNHGISVVGAGMNIDEARRPVIVERGGTKIGFLDYNCVGPAETWATPDKSGCAYVEIITHYVLTTATPGGLPQIYTFVERESQKAMVTDIRNLRPLCDVLVVVFHKGIGHTPAKLAAYEKDVAYAAVDAGADLVLAHHAHLLRGVEQYKGKMIFHGLGCFVLSSSHQTAEEERSAHSQKRLNEILEKFGFVADPKDPFFPHHPESKNTLIAKFIITDGKISRISFFPCTINGQRQPELLKHDKNGQQIFDYMEKITRAADLNTWYEWEGDEIVVHPK